MRHAGNRTSAIRFLLIKHNFEHPTILYVLYISNSHPSNKCLCSKNNIV